MGLGPEAAVMIGAFGAAAYTTRLFIPPPQNRSSKCGSPGLVVIGGDSCSEGRGFESQDHLLDGRFSHIFVVNIVIFV